MKILRVGLVLLVVTLSPFFMSAATGNYQFNDTCKQAYDAIISLRWDEANQLLLAEGKRHPNNLIVTLLEGYQDFLGLYLLPDKGYEAFQAAQDTRLDLLAIGDKQDPYYLFAQGELHLHNAFAALLNQEYFTAFISTRKAYKLQEQNLNKHPDFKPSQKSMALLKSLLGIIPKKYNMGLRLFGMSGNIVEGMSQLKALAGTTWPLQQESIIFYAMLSSHLEGKHAQAWDMLQKQNYPISNNLFSYFVTTDIAFYNKQNDAVIELVNEAPKGEQYPTLPIMQYYKGIAQLRKLDAAGINSLQGFLTGNRSTGYELSALQYIAWAKLITGDTAAYVLRMKDIALQSPGRQEADKMAWAEAKANVVPNVDLLKARLLYDGGYYDRALAILTNISTELPLGQQVEYHYRKGRILHDMQQFEPALKAYEATIEKGTEIPRYFACNAALKSAEIYEQMGNRSKAIIAYRQCLSINGYEYEHSLHQKARTGLERLE